MFVLTHHSRDRVEMKGGATFHFVTDGIESALEQAKKAADGKDVMLWGGGHVAQQYLAVGLLDELELHVVPVLLGGGSRLLENLGDADVRLEQVRAVEGPGVTHLKYRILPGCSIMIDVANISVIRHFGTHRTCQDLPCGVAADSRGISWAKPRPAAGACISGAGKPGSVQNMTARHRPSAGSHLTLTPMPSRHRVSPSLIFGPVRLRGLPAGDGPRPG